MVAHASDARNGTDYLSPGAVARLIGVAPNTVVKWCNKRGLPHYCIPGSNHRRLRRDAVCLWLKENGLPVPPALLPPRTLLVSDAEQLVTRWQAEMPFTLDVVPSLMAAGHALVSGVYSRLVFDLYTVPVQFLVLERPWLRTAHPLSQVAAISQYDTPAETCELLLVHDVALIERDAPCEDLCGDAATVSA
jgi:excisionase family DNA binding protein